MLKVTAASPLSAEEVTVYVENSILETASF
jgi:hypothetical protein